MPIIFGNVAAPSTSSAADGSNLAAIQGKQGDLLVSEVHGKYYTQAYRGNVYWGSAAATGLITTIFSNTTYVGFLLWNQSTTKNLSLISCAQGVILATTTVAAIGHCWLVAGPAIGTAVSAFTSITATRGAAATPAVTGQGASVALVGGGATLGTAFAWGRSNGMSLGTETTAIVHQLMKEDFDGTTIVPPGNLMAVLAASAAQGGTLLQSAVWEEAPI